MIYFFIFLALLHTNWMVSLVIHDSHAFFLPIWGTLVFFMVQDVCHFERVSSPLGRGAARSR